jgi:hypothetical protein
MEGQSYVCTLLKEELVFCVCLKSSNSMIVLHPKLLWRGCYRATRRNVLKPRTNLGVWLKQIQCKNCLAIAKLIALLFMYLRRLLDTHTHTHTHTICAQEMYYKVTLHGPQHDNCFSKSWGMNNHNTYTHTSCQKTHKSQNRLKWEHSSINEGSFFAYY